MRLATITAVMGGKAVIKSVKGNRKKLWFFFKRKAGKRLSNSGFTLIELLVALVVFAFGILGVIGMQLYAISGNTYSWNMSVAEKLAQQKLEYFKNMNYSAINTNGVFFGAGGEATGAYPTTLITSGVSVTLNDVLPVADRIPSGGDHDGDANVDNGNVYFVDLEDYAQSSDTINSYGKGIRRDHLNPPDLYKDDDGDNKLDPPYNSFRRITILKVIDGASTAPIDCSIVIKVLVYWNDSSGAQHKVSMMTVKGLGN